MKKALIETRYFTYIFVSLWKILAFVISGLVILQIKGDNAGVFTLLGSAFGEHKITLQSVRPTAGGAVPDLLEILPNGETEVINADINTPVHVVLLAIVSAYFMYIVGEFFFFSLDFCRDWLIGTGWFFLPIVYIFETFCYVYIIITYVTLF